MIKIMLNNHAGIFRAAILLLMLPFSQQSSALGLGDIEARSYLGQPLEARIHLMRQAPDELGSVTAGMASVADFEMMGLTRVASVPLHFDVHAEAAEPYIEVSSRLPVSDPVVQIVVEVKWAGGRMLREYMLFLDPPTIASKAPAPLVVSGSGNRRAAAVKPERESYPPPASIDVVETVKVPAVEIEDTARAKEIVPAPYEPEIPDYFAPEPAVEEQAPPARPARETVTVPDEPIPEAAADGAAVEDTAPRIAEAAAETEVAPDGRADRSDSESLADSIEPDPDDVEAAPSGMESMAAESAAEEPSDESAVAQEETPANESQEGGSPLIEDVTEEATPDPVPIVGSDPESGMEIYGPVERGQTMWGIASEFVRGTQYSVNQAMLAIQRVNPEAFGSNNINRLNTGVILRMPTFTEVEKLSRREASAEAIRQESIYLAMRSGQTPEALPAMADTVVAERDAAEEKQADALIGVADNELESGRLQLIPPAEPAGEDIEGSGEGERAVGALSSQELEEVLARTEEELANAQQENAYLNERIMELESELAQTGQDGAIDDKGLAAMEDSLREKRFEEAEAVSPEPVEEEAWYRVGTWWLGGMLLLLVAAVVWLLKRFSGRAGPGTDLGGEPADEQTATVDSIRSEAEDILKSLEEGSRTESPEGDAVTDLENHSKPFETAQGEKGQAGSGRKKPRSDSLSEEAVELDAGDPEVKLDLARAYISTGDTAAALQILGEVVEIGDEDQVREARGMMEEISQTD